VQPRVLIIIVCYNGCADTLACLRSLRRLTYDPACYEILVVDNASRDSTVAQVRALHPEVSIIETGANLGFAAGNNVGLRYALDKGFEYALLLNNDTEVEPDFLAHLVATCEYDSQIGVAGPTICYYEAPDTVWSAGGSINWQRGTSTMHHIGRPLATLGNEIRTVDFVTGCALFCRCTTLQQVGLLDERFFMYYEETEWCTRVQRAGLRIVHVPAAQIWHKIPLQDRVDRPYVAYYMTRNRLLFLQATRAQPSAWFDALFLQSLRTLASYTLRPKWRSRRAQRNAIWYGTRDFMLRRWGKGPL
jgi:GT2 family glycosyltransferase